MHVRQETSSLASERQGAGTVAGQFTAPACFHTRCSACGRPLRVSVQLLGQEVACQHCRYRFTAVDPTLFPAGTTPPIDAPRNPAETLLDRVDRLLQRLDAEAQQSPAATSPSAASPGPRRHAAPAGAAARRETHS